ncbi:MAG: RNA degradosome polyphosphate kinase [Bacteroidaceae bacterium]|jgi:polyphosphate kinase
MDKAKKTKYLHRDISWMYFNRRILQEAMRKEVPVMERLSFLGIYSNNLDEFFKVRVASITRIAECEDKSAQKEREQALDLLKEINTLNNRYAKDYEAAIAEVTADLREKNICLVDETQLTEEQTAYVIDYFHNHLEGTLMPVWISEVKQLTGEEDEHTYLAVKLSRHHGQKKRNEYAVIGMTLSGSDRFLRLPDKDGVSYVMYMDDVFRICLPQIFKGLDFDEFEAYAFKFTKDAEMEIDNDLRNGTLQKISKGVKSRRKGLPLRVVYDARMPKELRKKIIAKLNLDRLDTLLGGGKYQNHKDLMSFPDCGRKDLRYPRWAPIVKPELDVPQSLLQLINERDRFIHVPYHSFNSYLRLLQEAAIHREVRSIKTTLYRLAKDSKVVKALICAAKNGKKVTVVIELMARFDEAPNIAWSKKMQDAGIHVIFGVEGLKIHSKITHIEMTNHRHIACISTGNFHEGNARMYTDFLLMTANRRIVRDVASVFDFIEKPYTPVKFHELLVSPNEMKKKFLQLITNEIKNHLAGKPAYIRIKVNHITDPIMVKKLYEASAAGVPIDLSVRGNCSLFTGIPGQSETIHISGVIDRYLEHARIFIFAAGGEEKVFIGSADWMPRNLDYRIEVVTPVYDPQIKEELKFIVDCALRDTQQARIVDGTGRNVIPCTQGAEPFRSQEAIYKHYLEQAQSAQTEIPQDKKEVNEIEIE